MKTGKQLKRILTVFLALAMAMGLPAYARETEEDGDAALYAAGTAAVDACVDGSMTDVEKLTALHDWLALRCDYGDPLNGGTAYSAVVSGQAVCVGYAKGLAYLYALAGLDGADTYSAEMDHAWALATLDGVRYFSDCTWDDGKEPCLGLVRHNYWLFDENTAAGIWHYGWDSTETIPGGDLESAPWGAAVTRVIFSGGWAYYLDGGFRLIRCDRKTWETEELLALRARWPDTAPDDGEEPEICSGLVLIDGRLYFNTPYAVCSVDTEGGDYRIHRVDGGNGLCIYGVDVRDGVLCYALADDPDASRYEILTTDIDAADAWGY